MPSAGSQLISNLAMQMPTLAIFVVGIVVALVLWPKHPKVSAIAAGGLGVLLLNAVALSVAQSWLISSRADSGMSNEAFGQSMQAFALVRSVLFAGGFALVLWAVFAGRPRVDE